MNIAKQQLNTDDLLALVRWSLGQDIGRFHFYTHVDMVSVEEKSLSFLLNSFLSFQYHDSKFCVMIVKILESVVDLYAICLY